MISANCLLLLSLAVPCLLTGWSREVVVEVEGGLEQATDAAEQAGLDLLGEVLPESGLWHMGQPRRCKRSPGEVQASKHTQMLSIILHIFMTLYNLY